MKTSLRLRDSDKKSLGTISGINPDATPEDIALFVEGINGLRNDSIAYASVVTETHVEINPLNSLCCSGDRFRLGRH